MKGNHNSSTANGVERNEELTYSDSTVVAKYFSTAIKCVCAPREIKPRDLPIHRASDRHRLLQTDT